MDGEVVDDELVADDDDRGAEVAAEELGVELVGAVELHAPDPNTAANKAIRTHFVITHRLMLLGAVKPVLFLGGRRRALGRRNA
jgi:hypothetical protein